MHTTQGKLLRRDTEHEHNLSGMVEIRHRKLWSAIGRRKDRKEVAKTSTYWNAKKDTGENMGESNQDLNKTTAGRGGKTSKKNFIHW